MGLFSRVNKDEVNANNSSINQKKPQQQSGSESTSDVLATTKNVTGNVLGILGTALGVCGGVGAAVYVLNTAVAYFGFSVLATIIGFVGLGILFQFIAGYMVTDNWLERIPA